jgi:hypothetical protein
VVVAEPLLVDGGGREGEVASLIQNIESILAHELIFLLNIVDNSGRVVSQIGWHDRFSTVDHEEGGEASRSVDRSPDSLEDRGQLLDPAARSSFEGHLEAWLEAVEDALIGTLGLAIRLGMATEARLSQIPFSL